LNNLNVLNDLNVWNVLEKEGGQTDGR